MIAAEGIDHLRAIEDPEYRARMREQAIILRGFAFGCHPDRRCCAVEPLEATVAAFRQELAIAGHSSHQEASFKVSGPVKALRISRRRPAPQPTPEAG